MNTQQPTTPTTADEIISLFVGIESELNIVTELRRECAVHRERLIEHGTCTMDVLHQYDELQEQFNDLIQQRYSVIDLAINNGHDAGQLLRTAVAKLQERKIYDEDIEEIRRCLQALGKS